MGIHQRTASFTLTIIYVAEFFSRLATALLGERLKGKFILLYMIFTSLLSIISFLGSYTYNYTTMVLYATG